jgi:hypothetical protein
MIVNTALMNSNAFSQNMVLAYPDFTIPFEIYTDASNKQIGSVIQQSG